MDVSDYYKLATSFSEILRANNEKDIANELDKILENEDEDSPRIWVPKTHALLLNVYKQKINVPFAIEFLKILVAGENSKKYWK
jgi:hypothetical protein